MKKYLIFLLTCLITLSSTLVLAKDNQNDELRKLKSLEKQYGIILYNEKKADKLKISEIKKGKSDFLELNTIDELEELIKELSKEDYTIENNYEVEVSENDDTANIRNISTNARASSEINKERHYKQFKPYRNGALWCTYNIFTNYNYKFVSGQPYITKINSIRSSITGMNVAYTYKHNSSTKNLSNRNRTCTITTTGTGLFGVSVAGYDIGIPHTVHMSDKFTLTAK